MKTLDTFFGWLFIAIGGLSILTSAIVNGFEITSLEILGAILIVFGYIVLNLRDNGRRIA